MSEDLKYPSWTCRDCAIKAKGKHHGGCSTWHLGACDVCGEEKSVTEPRDFGYPKFKGHANKVWTNPIAKWADSEL